MRRLLPAGDRVRYAFALAGGLLLALAYPNFSIAGLAWIAPGAMLAAAFGTHGWRAFRIGCVAGSAHFLASLYWLLNIPVMKLAPFLGWLALSAYLALYTGVWTWLSWKLCPARVGETKDGWSIQLQRFTGSTWLQRAGWALLCATAWVALEMIRARLLTGFPWNLLGVSQAELVPLIQVSSVTGVYGVSFVVAWFSVALFCSGALLAAGGRSVRFAKLEALAPLLTVVALLAWGLRETMREPEVSPVLKIALIQPSIPQRLIWDPESKPERFAKLLELSDRALAAKPDVLVWPEGCVPASGPVLGAGQIHQALTNLTRRHGVWLIFNLDDVEPAKNPRHADDVDVYNAAILLSPKGQYGARYRKQRLVMFGEYIPFSRWLPFIERWTGMGNFAAGKQPVPFVVPELGFKTSALICFEDVFPQLARRHVEPDTDFLLNLTNDGWFGDSAAQWQHAATSVFRAVENGLPLVRCANNGITCWIDAKGRMHDEFLPGTRDAHGAGFKVVSVPLPGGATRNPTFYRKHGDVFGWACVAISAFALAATLTRARRASDSAKPIVKA